jgi:hypothetical protein
MATLLYEEECNVTPSYVHTDDKNDDSRERVYSNNYTSDRNAFCYALCEYNIICPCDDCRQSSIKGFCLLDCRCAICFHYRNCYDTASCNCRENSNAMYIATFCKDWTQDEVAEHHTDSKNTEDNGYDSDSDSDYESYNRIYPTTAQTRVVFDCGICFDCTSTYLC